MKMLSYSIQSEISNSGTSNLALPCHFHGSIMSSHVREPLCSIVPKFFHASTFCSQTKEVKFYKEIINFLSPSKTPPFSCLKIKKRKKRKISIWRLLSRVWIICQAWEKMKKKIRSRARDRIPVFRVFLSLKGFRFFRVSNKILYDFLLRIR